MSFIHIMCPYQLTIRFSFFFLLKHFCFNNTNTSVHSFIFFHIKDRFIYRERKGRTQGGGRFVVNPPLELDYLQNLYYLRNGK